MNASNYPSSIIVFQSNKEENDIKETDYFINKYIPQENAEDDINMRLYISYTYLSYNDFCEEVYRAHKLGYGYLFIIK